METKEIKINFPDKDSITIEKIRKKLKNNLNSNFDNLDLNTTTQKEIRETSKISINITKYINYLIDNNLITFFTYI